MIDAAHHLDDLRSPPSNHLELLRGDQYKHDSIPINDQWRICFMWCNQDAHDIEIVDYLRR